MEDCKAGREKAPHKCAWSDELEQHISQLNGGVGLLQPIGVNVCVPIGIRPDILAG